MRLMSQDKVLSLDYTCTIYKHLKDPPQLYLWTIWIFSSVTIYNLSSDKVDRKKKMTIVMQTLDTCFPDISWERLTYSCNLKNTKRNPNQKNKQYLHIYTCNFFSLYLKPSYSKMMSSHDKEVNPKKVTNTQENIRWISILQKGRMGFF